MLGNLSFKFCHLTERPTMDRLLTIAAYIACGLIFAGLPLIVFLGANR